MHEGRTTPDSKSESRCLARTQSVMQQDYKSKETTKKNEVKKMSGRLRATQDLVGKQCPRGRSSHLIEGVVSGRRARAPCCPRLRRNETWKRPSCVLALARGRCVSCRTFPGLPDATAADWLDHDWLRSNMCFQLHQLFCLTTVTAWNTPEPETVDSHLFSAKGFHLHAMKRLRTTKSVVTVPIGKNNK